MGKIIAWIVIVVIIVWGIFALTGKNDGADVVPPEDGTAAVGAVDTVSEETPADTAAMETTDAPADTASGENMEEAPATTDDSAKTE